MEAHNSMSARIAEEVVFEAPWASGPTTSARLCLRYSNEAPWTQVLEMLEFMADAAAILAHDDIGYSNFNSVRLRLKLEEHGPLSIVLRYNLQERGDREQLKGN